MLIPQTHAPRLRPVLVLADTAGLLAAIWLAHFLRFHPAIFPHKWQALQESPGFLLWAAFSCWILSAAAELYETDRVHRRWEMAIRVLAVVTIWAVSMMITSYVWTAWSFGRGLLLLTTFMWTPILLVNRLLFAIWMRQRSRFPALVVGDVEAVSTFCRDLEAHPAAPWKPIDGSGIALDGVSAKVKELGVRLIVVAGSESGDVKNALDGELTALHFSGVPVVAAVDLCASLEERLPIETLSPALLLHQPGFGAVPWHPFHRLAGLLDFLLAGLLLVLSSPVLILSAILIALTDGMPIVYRQTRLGQFGRPFECLKLRTMVRDAEKKGPRFADENDPRITRIGRFLRRFRIDELPQLINVLRGDMALVGPRPERPAFVAELARLIPFYTFRLALRPGITGWAQVNAPYARDLEGHRRKLEFDLYYIREPALQLYALTLLRTTSAVLVGSRRRPMMVGSTLPRTASDSPVPATSLEQAFEGVDDAPPVT